DRGIHDASRLGPSGASRRSTRGFRPSGTAALDRLHHRASAHLRRDRPGTPRYAARGRTAAAGGARRSFRDLSSGHFGSNGSDMWLKNEEAASSFDELRSISLAKTNCRFGVARSKELFLGGPSHAVSHMVN